MGRVNGQQSQPPPASAAAERVRFTTSTRPPTARMIGQRYRFIEELGRGGMAEVYRTQDTVTGTHLALKLLSGHDDGPPDVRAVSMFEREFHGLKQLAHPHIVAAYDYGIHRGHPFYTMELLDGEDVRACSPMPVERACLLALEVASALALMHSRRQVHRDVSPRNVRIASDGHAKLIDFGAMAPVGPGSPTVGTPAFVAPEVVHRTHVDGRADLFSLGATLYYMLTGRQPFSARRFAELRAAWAAPLSPPSSVQPDVPQALDLLCMALLRIDPDERPRGAFEVIQRLAAIAGVAQDDSISVSRAYLETPTLVGRDESMQDFRRRIRTTLHGRGGTLLFQGEPGMGRTRILDACVLEAKTLGATTLHVIEPPRADLPFAHADQLAEELFRLLPDAAPRAARDVGVFEQLFEAVCGPDGERIGRRPLVGSGSDRDQSLSALSSWIARVSEERALVLAVDDLQLVDEASVALIAMLARRAPSLPLLIVASMDARSAADAVPALSLLRQHGVRLGLTPLSRAGSEALLRSVFGDVPHVPTLATRLHDIALGNPRETMSLAQHLLDSGVVRYTGGQWTLPAELSADDLPETAADALASRLLRLPPLARSLAEAHALLGSLSLQREDYAALAPDARPGELDAALSALLSHQVLRGDGRYFRLAHEAVAETLCALLGDEERRRRHLSLFEMQQRGGNAHAYVLAGHLLAAGRYQEALDRLASTGDLTAQRAMEDIVRMDVGGIARTLERALALVVTLGRPRREEHELRRRLCTLAPSMDVDGALFERVAPAWLAQLELDSGLADYRRARSGDPREQRLQRAMARAGARHDAMPEHERVYRPEEAVRYLALYVMLSLSIGNRVRDGRLLASLTPLLEPFVSLTPPLIGVLYDRSRATNALVLDGQRLRARDQIEVVYRELHAMVQQGESGLLQISVGLSAWQIGLIEASLGRPEALAWADVLDGDPLQRVNAMALRRGYYRMRGDAAATAYFAEQAELLALQTGMWRFVAEPWDMELRASLLAHDLVGIKRVLEAVGRLAERLPGWQAMAWLSEGHFQRLRGDVRAADARYQAVLSLGTPGGNGGPVCVDLWVEAVAGRVATLAELDHVQTAIEFGQIGLSTCQSLGVEITWHAIAVALATAEAKAGRGASAVRRLQEVLDGQEALGVGGLERASALCARARVAVWQGDEPALNRYAELAKQACPGAAGGALSRLMDTLREQAQARGIALSLGPSAFEASVLGAVGASESDPHADAAQAALANCQSAIARAECAAEALSVRCGGAPCHLYLVDLQGTLQWRAAFAAAAPTPELSAFAAGFFQQQVEDEALTGGLSQTSAMISLPGVATYFDPSGATHQLVLFSAHRDETLFYVGLAVVRADQDRPVSREAVAFGGGLAKAFLSAGDTPGVSVFAPDSGR